LFTLLLLLLLLRRDICSSLSPFRLFAPAGSCRPARLVERENVTRAQLPTFYTLDQISKTCTGPVPASLFLLELKEF
jgi:hypothetical protein